MSQRDILQSMLEFNKHRFVAPISYVIEASFISRFIEEFWGRVWLWYPASCLSIPCSENAFLDLLAVWRLSNKSKTLYNGMLIRYMLYSAGLRNGHIWDICMLSCQICSVCNETNQQYGRSYNLFGHKSFVKSIAFRV